MADREKLLALARKFEAEILYDAHSLESRIRRSDMRRKIDVLSRHEKDFLRAQVPLRRSELPLLQKDLETAWSTVLR